MLTIRLKWFYLTYKGIKTIEVRKSAPKDFAGDVYEVVSKTNFEKDLMQIPENEREFFKQFKGKVGLKFTLNRVEEIGLIKEVINLHYTGKRFIMNKIGENIYDVSSETLRKSCLTYEEISNYLKGKKGYAWHISNLVVFDRPKELGEFKHYNKPSCDGCPFQYSIECDYHREVECDDIPLIKAPQSWQFIEVKE